jgi:high-affinity Fe2+/Pb2+ permease
MTEDIPIQEENQVQDKPPSRKGPGIYQVFEAGVLGVAAAIVYAFGILRFASALTQIWGRNVAIVFTVFALVIAVAFIDAVSRLINDSRQPKDDDKA